MMPRRARLFYDIFGRFLYNAVGEYPKVFEKALGIASYLPDFSADAGAGVKTLEQRRKSWLYTYSLRSDLNLSAPPPRFRAVQPGAIGRRGVFRRIRRPEPEY